MALDPPTEGYSHTMHDAGDILSSLDWRNIGPSVGATFAEIGYMGEISGESERMGTAYDDNNVRMRFS